MSSDVFDEYKSTLNILTRKAAEAMEALEKEILAIPTEDKERRTPLIKLLSQFHAVSLIHEYDNVEIAVHRGLHIEYKKGVAVNAVPNGKKSCSMALWGGMERFTADSKEMCTYEYDKVLAKTLEDCKGCEFDGHCDNQTENGLVGPCVE